MSPLDVTSIFITSELMEEQAEETYSLEQRIHRLRLLRYWILHFVRLIHDHFCSVVFLPFSRDFESLCNSAESYFQVIQGFFLSLYFNLIRV